MTMMTPRTRWMIFSLTFFFFSLIEEITTGNSLPLYDNWTNTLFKTAATTKQRLKHLGQQHRLEPSTSQRSNLDSDKTFKVQFPRNKCCCLLLCKVGVKKVSIAPGWWFEDLVEKFSMVNLTWTFDLYRNLKLHSEILNKIFEF